MLISDGDNMKTKLLFKILKVTICILFSIVLVLGVVVIPFYYSITALTKPETVSMVIQEVDYKKIIKKNPAIKKTLAKYDITPEKADTIMKSKQTGELVEIYADEVTEIFLNIPEDKKLDVPYIKEIVEENTDKFLDIAEEKTNFEFERDIAKQSVDEFFEKNEVIIEESVAMIEEVRDVVKTIYTSSIVQKELSFWIALVIVAVAFIVIGTIIVLMRSNGFLLIGLEFGLCTSLLCFIIAFSKSVFITNVALKISDFGTQIVESAISVSVDKMVITVFGSIIMAVLFLMFFAVIKLLKNKYQKQSSQVKVLQ